MKERVMPLLSLTLLSIHFADDVVRGMSPGGLENLVGILVIAVWLYAILEMFDRRSGQIVNLLGSLAAAVMPLIHFRGSGVGGSFAQSSGALFFIWTLYALGVTGALSFMLSVRRLRRGVVGQ